MQLLDKSGISVAAQDDSKATWRPVKPVGIVCHFPPPPGGMPGQAQAYLEGLRKEGVPAVRIQTNLGSSYIATKLDSIRGVRSILRFIVFLNRLIYALPRVGTLHVMACSGLSFFLFVAPAVALGSLLKRKIVLQYQSGTAKDFFRSWPRFTSWIIHKADKLQVESAFLQNVFHTEMQLDSVIVANICDWERYCYNTNRAVWPSFIVARHLEEIYNVSCVIRAFALVRKDYPESVLSVLGSGPEETKLKRLARQLGVQEAVRFLGYVENKKMPELYDQAAIALNASNVDNSPNAILEAFAAGLPVISTCAGGIPYMVEDGVTGFLVKLDDHQAMAKRAVQLLQDPELARTIAANAREKIKEHSWSHIFPKVLKMYEDMASQ